MPRHRTDYQVRMILKQNRDGSPDCQKARHQNLIRCIKQLQARGYGQRWDVHRIGRREVTRLVHDWRAAGLNHRTVANRLVDLRWLAGKLGREYLVPSNKDLGIRLRKNSPEWGTDRSRELDHARLQRLDQRAQLITELRREFGLRAAEAMKFQHEFATREPDKIRLADSWCKGGRYREVPITTDRQRDLLDRVGRFQVSQPTSRHGHRSMIPAHRTFDSYYREYNVARHAAGLPGHELRHAWAQERFEQLAGFPPPLAGGPKFSELAIPGQHKWEEAAGIVNRELGHGEGRQDITSTYIGVKA